MIDMYLPRAIEMHRQRMPYPEGTEQEIIAYLRPELERFLNKFGQLDEEGLRKTHFLVQCEAYNLGILVSKEYSEEEIENIKQEYLSLLPSPSSGRSVQRWKYEVERQFSRRDFHLYPDKIFLMLDRYVKIGTY